MKKRHVWISAVLTVSLSMTLAIPTLCAERREGGVPNPINSFAFDENDVLEGYKRLWFRIEISSTKGGSVSPGVAMVLRRGDKEFNFTAEPGYIISDVRVDGVSVGAVTHYTFYNVMENHTLQVIFAPQKEVEQEEPDAAKEYRDLDAEAWYYGYVNRVLAAQWMDGTGEGEFSPDQALTRAVLLEALYRMAGKPVVEDTLSFPDVPSDSPYAQAIAWGVEKGLVSGYGDGTFGPDDPVTRQQMALIFWKAKGAPEVDAYSYERVLSGYQDRKQVAQWAMDGVVWAVNTTLMVGTGENTLSPESGATRAEACVLLEKLNNI